MAFHRDQTIPCDFRILQVRGTFEKLSLFAYSWWHWVFIAARERLPRCSSRATLSRGARVSQCGGFSFRRARAPGHRAQGLWCVGLVAQQHVEASQSRVETVSPALAGVFLILDHQGSPGGTFNSCVVLDTHSFSHLPSNVY